MKGEGRSETNLERLPPPHAVVRASYDRWSRVYGFVADPWERRPRRRALGRLAVLPGERALEVGVGSGADLRALSRSGGEVWGLDLSMGMLRRARRTPVARLICADAVAIPLATETFDALYASFTLELFGPAESPIVLSEMHRLLRTGGRLAIVSLAAVRSSPLVRVYEWTHRHFPALVDCRPIAARAALEEAGFAIDYAARDHVAGLPVDVLLARKPAERRP